MIKNIELTPGYLKVTDDFNRSHLIAITDVLRAADIPALTYEQVAAVKVLANLTSVLIRTLIDRELLDESFLENNDYNLDDIIQTIEDIGGSYHDPSLSLT